MEKKGAFRFAYFTEKFAETRKFYEKTLQFELAHAWDRDEHDKGALFEAGAGFIEILLVPGDDEHKSAGLDYRSPQGAFMGIQVWDIDALFARLKSVGVTFKQDITDQTWGHRSFSVIEPNGLVLFFFEEQF
ncbi:MAG: VOC family protein [Woeseiaceae bacterium]|nr:VOC family protein [Woeseiaceae bacterium]